MAFQKEKHWPVCLSAKPKGLKGGKKGEGDPKSTGRPLYSVDISELWHINKIQH